MATWNLHNYDRWGNDEDGYEVNDVYGASLSVDLPDDATDAQILAVLAEASGTDTSKVQVDGSTYAEDAIYLNDENGWPLAELRKTKG